MSIAAKRLSPLKGEKLKSVQRVRTLHGVVLAARSGKAHSAHDERAGLEDLERRGEIKLGSGNLGDDFWNLPQPDDQTDSVRRALNESRG